MRSELSILTFCANIKKLRIKENLSKTKMCKILKISTLSLKSIENGILPKRISCNVLLRACVYFNLKADDILSSIVEK